MRDMSWHRFVASTDDDNECTHCGVIVAEDALGQFALPCPAPDCPAEDNDGRCVFVRGVRGPECAYCDRRGSSEGDDELDEPLLDDPEVDLLLAQADALLAQADLDAAERRSLAFDDDRAA